MDSAFDSLVTGLVLEEAVKMQQMHANMLLGGAEWMRAASPDNPVALENADRVEAIAYELLSVDPLTAAERILEDRPVNMDGMPPSINLGVVCEVLANRAVN